MIQMHMLRIFPAKFATSYAHIRIDGRGADQFLPSISNSYYLINPLLRLTAHVSILTSKIPAITTHVFVIPHPKKHLNFSMIFYHRYPT